METNLSEQLEEALIDEVLLRLYEESLPRILKCINELTTEQVWWRPNESSNSIGNLVLHLCGNVSQWIYSGLGGFADQRTRQAEFDERGNMGKTELTALLLATMEKVKPVIRNLPADQLLRRRPVQTFQETGLSILVHVTEHFSYHTGQIAYITKMLSGKPLGFYDGVSLE
jgi:uncharacterized damage-inducible protein DinB